MLRVKDTELFKRIGDLKSQLNDIEVKVRQEANATAVQNGWDEKVEEQFVDFLFANDKRFDTNKLQAELDLLSSFVEEVEDEQENTFSSASDQEQQC